MDPSPPPPTPPPTPTPTPTPITTRNLASITIDSSSEINVAFNVIDKSISQVTDISVELGAYQNRFEAVNAVSSNMSEQTAASRSRILDADIAEESANHTRNAILQQAGTAILAQANQQPQLVLQLLGSS